ncbi:MAG: radical SAM-associated putative lipoprotein [Prevotella sp.]|jgi:putative lipoprotein (rSAM/lipoprotein system)|nr:radical SAM-associated putative lipoprotein [Prevotella sp.]
MKVKMLSVYSKILSFFLVLLGFSSCDSGGGGAAEYGTPTAKFKVKGTIVDESEAPITKIKTVLGKSYKTELGDRPYYIDSVFTDSEGKFELNVVEFPTSQEFILKIEDVDGDENGAFETKIETVEFKDPSFTNGNNGWYAGETTKDIQAIKITSAKKD